MSKQSLVETAAMILAKEGKDLKFKELFDKVIAELGEELSEAELRVKMSKLYTQLSLDGRFVTLTDNTWDLSSRHVFDERHIDMSEAYSDDDEGGDEDVDMEERKLEDEELGVQSDDDSDEENTDLDFDKEKSSDEDEDF